MDAGKTLTVRKLRKILNDLPPGLKVVIEGTEWDLPARSANVTDWISPEGVLNQPEQVLMIGLGD